MYICFKDGKRKAMTLSYDDGVVQDIRLSEILKKHGLKCTFNISSGLFLEDASTRERYYGKMTLEEAVNLYTNSGNEVAVHGEYHKALGRIASAEATYDVVKCREGLENIFKYPIRGMAYAYGSYNDDTLDILKNSGIVYSRTTQSTNNFNLPANWLELHPTCHHNNPELFNLLDNFLSADPYPARTMMFYLWGHSYEFDNDNNWEVIEKFAEIAGGNEDVWYATNIEIYEYVNAYKSLIATIDDSVIYNPTTTDVWVFAGNEKVCIKSGETYRK